jgi:two-component system sensor histidine kinase CpxA
VRAVVAEEAVIHGSEEMLRRGIENVVRNAVRYTAEGTEVEIAVSRRRGDSGEAAVIRVRDHGPGVPEEALSRMFLPFYRVADARDRQTGGTGIGLAVTERAIRLHKGTVAAANAPDGGLVVEMLPITDRADA